MTLAVWPGEMSPVSQLPSDDVAVCACEPVFVHVTVLPAAITARWTSYENSMTLTALVLTGAAVKPTSVGGALGAANGASLPSRANAQTASPFCEPTAVSTPPVAIATYC